MKRPATKPARRTFPIMATIYQTELQEARRRLAEGLERLREQAEQVEILARDGKPTETARDLLGAMRATVEELQRHIRYLVDETKDRQA